MERDFRFRVSGLLFVIVILLNLAFSNNGKKLISDLLAKATNLEFLQILLGTILIVFASDAIGYIFNSIAVFIFNRSGGYSGKFKKHLGYSELRDSIIQTYDSMNVELPNDFSHDKFRLKWDAYNTEHFFVNFFWHRSELPSNLNEWLERRYNAYFTAHSCSIALIIATLISFVTICNPIFGISPVNWIVLLFTGFGVLIFVLNGKEAMKDAMAITDLHIAEYVNPRVRKILGRYQTLRTMSKERKILSYKKNNNI
jgi:hypothetical protein